MLILRDIILKTFYYGLAVSIILSGYAFLVDLDREEEDFLYLAGVVEKATKGKKTQREQIKALTEWLSKNVAKTTEYPGWEQPGYPDWFDGSSVASVIKGGIGNCGYQANNIITLSRYLGVREHRRYWVSEQTGSEYEHAFAELVINDRPEVYDPNMLIYQENENGGALSLAEMVKDPSMVENKYFRRIANHIKDKPGILRMTPAPRTPEPLGKNSYFIYAAFGETVTKMYLHLNRNPLTILVLSWLVFMVISATRDAIVRRSGKTT